MPACRQSGSQVRRAGMPEWAELLGDFLRIVAWREPGEGAERFVASLAHQLASRLLVLDPPAGIKDMRALWLACAGDRGEMRRRWTELRATARAWTELEAERVEAERSAALAAAGKLASIERILDEVATTAAKLGLAGEHKAIKLSYLVLISALADEPLAAVLRGTAAAGKSQVLKTAARMVPDDAVVLMTAMSPRALAYTEEDLRHRTLVLIEADAVASGDDDDGRAHVAHARVRARDRVPIRCRGQRSASPCRRSARVADHDDARDAQAAARRTRLLSIPADDSRGQTAAVIAAAFAAESLEDIDIAPFHALYRWLGAGARSATVPYGGTLARLIKPVAVRLRRDARHSGI